MFSFPRTVNEKAARTVAACVCAIAVVALATGAHWLLAVLAVGFFLRVGWGPRFDPLGRLAVHVVAPRLGEPRTVSGPPKRFAQAMGLAMTGAGAVLALGFGLAGAGDVLLAMVAVAAFLEAAFAFCLGCKVFGLLMRAGVIPDEVCAECTDIWSRPGMAAGRS
jgi:uncharacterized iron-regulated membrane protein